ncbi:MAG: ligase-associated DNA damage response endonuclease PdeM [Burkholderiaceae bacterium]
MSDGLPTPEIVVAGMRLLPLAARAAWLPELQTLLVADVHLGKARSFTTWGVPVPGDVDAATLARLTTVIEAAAARRLVVLGDWLHGPRALDAVLLQRLESWRRRHAEVEIIVIGGNHDRRAPRLPPALDIDCVDGPITLPDAAGLVLDHDPVTRSPRPTTEDGYRLAGHWHPVVRLRGRADALRLPCFIFGPREGVLPAFGEFTGGHPVRQRPGDRLFVAAGDRIRELPAMPAISGLAVVD